MLRILLPLGAMLFFLCSFTFFDGWPFGDDEPRADGDSAAHDGGGGGPDDGDSARTVSRRPVPPRQERSEQRDVLAELARLEAADPSSWHGELSREVVNGALTASVRSAIVGKLDDAIRRTILDGRWTEGMRVVPVRSGDNLTVIARRARKEHGNNVTAKLIMVVNGLSHDRIRVGQKLRVPTESLTVRVRKDDFRLFVYLGDRVLRHYPVGTGESQATPDGDFLLKNKARNPSWRDPETGQEIPFGDPRHVIGTRWLAFWRDGSSTGFGIHGTTDEGSIGRAASAGCLRMHRRDVEELFDLVPEGCPITVS